MLLACSGASWATEWTIPLSFKVSEVRVSGGVELPGRVELGDMGFRAYSPGYDFDVSCVFNIGFGRFISLEPSVGAFTERYAIRNPLDVKVEGIGSLLSGANVESGVRAGLMLVGQVYADSAIGVNLFTGPSFDIGCSGSFNYEYRITKDGRAIKGSENLYDGSIDPLNTRWVAGVGLTFSNWQLRLSGGYGITDRYESTTRNSSYSQSNVMLSVGYRF